MMEILKILEESGKNLYPEDLDFFETELATGEYDVPYQTECIKRIRELRAWMAGDVPAPEKEKETPPNKKKKRTPKELFVKPEELGPAGAVPEPVKLGAAETVFRDISEMRGGNSYKTKFKEYVESRPEIDAAFVDAHYSFFKPWELDAVISVRQMPEEFLEKYFGALDHDKIARYQTFSESFFMKHYADLDANVVLGQGRNEWRRKEKRSKQLDVFLRLKGVTF